MSRGGGKRQGEKDREKPIATIVLRHLHKLRSLSLSFSVRQCDARRVGLVVKRLYEGNHK